MILKCKLLPKKVIIPITTGVVDTGGTGTLEWQILSHVFEGEKILQ
jgi:hypothetical protein